MHLLQTSRGMPIVKSLPATPPTIRTGRTTALATMHRLLLKLVLTFQVDRPVHQHMVQEHQWFIQQLVRRMCRHDGWRRNGIFDITIPLSLGTCEYKFCPGWMDSTRRIHRRRCLHLHH